VLPDDVIQEVIPPNIRKAEDFIDLLQRFLQYLQARLNTKQVISEPPLAFLQSCQEATKIVPKTLRYRALGRDHRICAVAHRLCVRVRVRVRVCMCMCVYDGTREDSVLVDSRRCFERSRSRTRQSFSPSALCATLPPSWARIRRASR
jgi:hypothetical protein